MAKPKLRLAKEITLCLILKVILLTSLWWICFSHPLSASMQANGLVHIFSSTSSSTSTH